MYGCSGTISYNVYLLLLVSTVFEIYVFVCHHRALDNQVYAAGVSVARDESASYVSWANSTLVSPW